jgi:hypothetical protein
MAEDILGYSSHDWRKHTDDAIVTDDVNNPIVPKTMKVNNSRVIFTNPKTLKEETVDVSRLIRVFVNNVVGHRKSIK